VRSHALAPKCRTKIDGGTMWSRKKDPPAGGVCCCRLQRGWNIERENEWEREREEKSQGWNGAGRRPLIKIPWHIAVCYTTTIIYACSIYTICEIHTRTQPPSTSVYPQYTGTLVCVCVCVLKPIDLISDNSVNRYLYRHDNIWYFMSDRTRLPEDVSSLQRRKITITRYLYNV